MATLQLRLGLFVLGYPLPPSAVGISVVAGLWQFSGIRNCFPCDQPPSLRDQPWRCVSRDNELLIGFAACLWLDFSKRPSWEN